VDVGFLFRRSSAGSPPFSCGARSPDSGSSQNLRQPLPLVTEDWGHDRRNRVYTREGEQVRRVRKVCVSSRQPRILMYHGICRLAEDPYGICTSSERFLAQMRYLKLRKLRGVSVQELLRATDLGAARGLVGLTFDDGYEDFLHIAIPVLERFGFSATLFVLGGMPRENNWDYFPAPRPQMKLLGAAGIREVAARGMEVGSHGMSHLRLAGLEPELLKHEVINSRRVLGEVLGEEVAGFCYPYGTVDRAAIRAVRGARYAYACAITERIEQNLYDLPRIPVAERDDLPRFAAKLEIFAQYHAARKVGQRIIGSRSPK
jgi:peptidoglycan/xylan/chitin deacetylase (PgdA/CDA1 family)